MGNVQVQYKQRRGANEAGTDVTDPKDFFTEMLSDEQGKFDGLKAAYDGLDADKQDTFKSFFDGDDVMQSKQRFSMWLNENESDSGYLGEVKGKVEEFCAGM